MSSLDQVCWLPCHEWKLSLVKNFLPKVGLSPHGAMLPVTNDIIVLQDNLLHNFTDHCRDIIRPIISRVILLALLENWNKALPNQLEHKKIGSCVFKAL